MSRVFFFACALLALLPAASEAAPAGWQSFTDHRHLCQASVPADWKPGEYNVGMVATKGKANVIVSSSPLGIAMAKQVTANMFKPTKVFEDSPNRYWIQYAPSNPALPRNDYYVALQQPGITCAMQLSWDGTLADSDAKEIVASLKKH